MRVSGLLIAGLLAVSCGGGGGSGAEGGDSTAPPAVPQRPVPIESALEVTGTAVLKPTVALIDLALVQTIGEDATGTVLTVDARAPGLIVGDLFVVPGVASGRVTRIEPGSGVTVVHFEQPDLTELFDALDVSFAGRPDPSRVVWETDEATAAGAGSAIEMLELGALEDLPDAPEPGEGASAEGAMPTGMAESGTLQRVVASNDDDDETNADDEGDDPAARGCRPAGESSIEQSVSGSGSQQFTAKAGDYQVEVQHRLDAGCGTHYFKINSTRNDDLAITGSLFGWVRSEYVQGEMVLTEDSIRSTVDLEVAGEMWFSVAGQVKSSLRPSGVKISYDLVKKDIPVVVGGVPFLIRLGAPMTFEARMTSAGDTLTATLLHLSCDGRFGSSGEGTPETTCTAAPVTPHIAESFAPAAFIVAAGFKAGFGPGVSIPMSRTTRNTLFAGATATLSSSTGLTRSGTAGAPLIDCSRIDRSVQFNLGAEAQVFGVSLSTGPTNVWSKSATDNWGRQCPTSGM